MHVAGEPPMVKPVQPAVEQSTQPVGTGGDMGDGGTGGVGGEMDAGVVLPQMVKPP